MRLQERLKHQFSFLYTFLKTRIIKKINKLTNTHFDKYDHKLFLKIIEFGLVIS